MDNPVVTFVDEASTYTKYNIGREGIAFLRLAEQEQSLVPTFLLGTRAFEEFRKSARLPKQCVDDIIAFASAVNAPELTIRPAAACDLSGMPSQVTVPIEDGRISHAIERVYRLWGEDRLTAFRMANGIVDSECLPAIVIQAITATNLSSLGTRDPILGTRTDASNLTRNIHNTLAKFEVAHAKMLDAVERANKSPTKVYFEDQSVPRISRLEDQLLTPQATLIALSQMNNAGFIDDLDVVMQLRPNMLIEAVSPKIVGQAPSCRGLPASPGLGWGTMVLPYANSDLLREAQVVLVTTELEWRRGDQEILRRSSGGVSSRGGMASHLAVVARGMGRPAVVGAGHLVVDLDARCVFLGSMKFEEGSRAALDGTTGEVWLGLDHLRINDGILIKQDIVPHIKWIENIISDLSTRSGFTALDEGDRIRLAHLRRIIERASNK